MMSRMCLIAKGVTKTAMTLTAAPVLSRASLNTLPPIFSKPQYHLSSLKPGIIHFGVGNFHRAHQALYLHHLFNQQKDHDFAIIGAGVLPQELPHYDTLRKQDYLSVVVEQSLTHTQATVIAPMLDFIRPTDSDAILAALERPEIRIVSLTITEGGYYTNDDGSFNESHPDVKERKTLFTLLATALDTRRQRNIPPFTVMSCDNVPHNGAVARQAVVEVARLQDETLSQWIHCNVSFPNSMVDRITPGTSDRERALVREMGVVDHVPVFCEQFRQWILEDNFSCGRPRWENVGVQFVSDVTPFEIMKIRVLNGGHATIAYPAGLLGIQFVHDAMQHQLVSKFLDKVERNEILPVVPPVPGTNVNEYLELICSRFANPKIGDTVRRLCLDGSNRQPKFVIPSIKDRLRHGQSVQGLALVSALWCRYCYGVDEAGDVIERNDPNWDKLLSVAKDARQFPVSWLKQKAIYGDLAENEVFSNAFSVWLLKIWSDGTIAALQTYIDNGSTS